MQVITSGAVGRGLLGNILHEGHSLSSPQTIFGPKWVTWSFPVCECLVVFSSCFGNRRGIMAKEHCGWTENGDFSLSITFAMYSVILCKWHLIFFILNYAIVLCGFFFNIYTVWTALIKHHGLSGWEKKNWNLFLTVLKQEIWDQSACVVRWGCSSKSQVTPCILTRWRGQRAPPILL